MSDLFQPNLRPGTPSLMSRAGEGPISMLAHSKRITQSIYCFRDLPSGHPPSPQSRYRHISNQSDGIQKRWRKH
jgi:hypothetical protein